MIMTNFLQKRKSVRDFKKKAVSRDIIENIKKDIEEAREKTSKVDFKFYENGSIIFNGLKGKAGYNGVMIEAPSYVALVQKDGSKESFLNTGYYMERLNTKIVNENLDSCWITVDDVDDETKKNLFGEDGEKVNFIIAFGYGVGKKLFIPEATSDRYSVNEIVFKDTLDNPVEDEDLEELGLFDIMSSVRYAPSHMNLQPWRFVLRNNEVFLYIKKSDHLDRSLVDCGVVMFYFEEMAKTIGRYGKWTVLLNDDGDYIEVSSFKM